MIYGVLLLILVMRLISIVVVKLSTKCCVKEKNPLSWCCRCGIVKFLFFDTSIGKKQSQVSFYDALTDKAREQMLREEIGTRDSTGIEHLSDKVLKRLMQSMYKDSDNPQRGCFMGSFSYDCLQDRKTASRVAYVPYSRAKRTCYLGGGAGMLKKQKQLELARIAVDFAYLDRERAKGFNFAEYCKSADDFEID